MEIDITAGSFGVCRAEFANGALTIPGRVIRLGDIAELSVGGLDMAHGAGWLESQGLALSAVFGGVHSVASAPHAGNVMAVSFRARLQSGEEFMAKADSETFARLKDAYLSGD